MKHQGRKPRDGICRDGMSLTDCAKELGLTQMAVMRIERRGLEKLVKWCHERGLVLHDLVD